MHEIISRKDLGLLATFVPNKNLGVYNWFHYKEGFARDLVFMLIERFNLGKGDNVLDPFCGVGTTLLACKQKGINSVGFDAAPLAAFVANTKLADYEIESIKLEAENILSKKFVKPERMRVHLEVVKKSFPQKTLEDLFFYKKEIESLKDEKTRNFLLLALMNASTKTSYARKKGSTLDIRKKATPPLKLMFKKVLVKMLKDLKEFDKTNASAQAFQGDARKLPLEDEVIDAVITSPPYLNKIEYTKVYSIENYIFFPKTKEKMLRSCVGLEQKQAQEIFPNQKLPIIANSYFSDMNQVFKELYRVCVPGARIGLVVGNGCFVTGVVESDVLLAELAERNGFKVQGIEMMNERVCEFTGKKVGKARESLILFSKP